MHKRARKLLPLLLGLALLVNSQGPTLAQSAEEQTVLTALSLNIVRFTTWPPETQIEDTIKFCVIGDNTVQQSFADIDHKTVAGKTLKITNLSRLRNFEDCHVLYISDLKTNILVQVLLEIKKQPLLTIGEGYDFTAQGGMVGMENVNGKIILYVNLAVALESNLNISSRLLKLAKIVGN